VVVHVWSAYIRLRTLDGEKASDCESRMKNARSGVIVMLSNDTNAMFPP
jgi:hypothetical protein